MALFDDPPHAVDVYIPDSPTMDSGGGVKLNWPVVPSQLACPCAINTLSARTLAKSHDTGIGQIQITVGNTIGILTEALQVTLVRGTKFIAVDTGRTFVMQGLRSPNREYGQVPQLTYIDCEEYI